MNILAISSRVPAAERKGEQVVSFFRLMYLARTNAIEVVCFGDVRKSEDREAKKALEEAGIAVHFVEWNPWVALAQMLLAVTNPRMPFQCAFFRSTLFQKTIENLCSRFGPDALYCVMIRIFPNAAAYKGRMFVDMVDSMSLNFSRRARATRGVMRWLLNLELRRVRRLENTVVQRAARSFVVSQIDKNAIGSDKVDVVPLGIDLQRFKNEGRGNAGTIVTFTGNMNYRANVDAVQWFVRRCWAEVRALVPSARLVIAGSNPRRSVVALGEKEKSISVTGRVTSIAAILNTATVAIAPMQSGSGMQFKILEAMACGVPVVTTTLGLGGISALPGEDILVADSPADFVEAVVSLLTSESLRRDIGERGMRHVYVNHDWDQLNERFAIACGIDGRVQAMA